MDIDKVYQDIQNRYNLKDRVHELYLYENYLQICLRFFEENYNKKIAIYGGGRNTEELIQSVIWVKIKNQIKVIIDNHIKQQYMQDIPVDGVHNLLAHDVDIVFISTWKYREKFKNEVKENLPLVEIFDPYDEVIKELPQANTAFFTYKGNNKYQWFAERRRKLNSEDDKSNILIELIHGYYAIYDWVNVKKCINIYFKCPNIDKKYQFLYKDIEHFIQAIKDTVNKRKQKDIVIFLVDALSKFVVEDMYYLSEWKKKGLSFENYINVYPATREVIMELLTGWMPFENKTYLNKEIEYSDSELLEYIKKEQIEIKYISAANVRHNLKKINTYYQGVNEDILLTEVIHRGISSLCKSEKQQIIIMHAYDTIHPLHWNPISVNLTWKNTSWEEHKSRFNESVIYTDEIINFNLNMLYDNKEIVKIVMGDHGINLKTEYTYEIANKIIEGEIGLWDIESISPALIILDKKYKSNEIKRLVSSSSFNKILHQILKKECIEKVLKNKRFLELQFVPAYNESWIKRVINSRNYYLGMGLKGLISENYIFTSFENGTERLFKIDGKKLKECTELKSLFIKEIGNENIYKSCKFPNDILKDNFFETHNQYYI